MTKQLKTVPQFANETEEQAFWEKHDSTDYLDWTKAQRIVLPNLKVEEAVNLISISNLPFTTLCSNS